MGLITSVILNVLLAAALLLCLAHMARYREERKQRGVMKPWPIARVDVGDWSALLKASALGPRRETEVRFLPAYGVRGGISDFESWILCNLAKPSRLIFEFGTCTGKTTYLLAANAPEDARVITITLRPTDLALYRSAPGDEEAAVQSTLHESVFTDFYYAGTREEKKITQLFGNTKDFDESPYRESCDLVFVDASHARSFVESDSRKAMNMVRPGGLVLWHDYRGRRRSGGVFQVLNALAKEIPLVHLADTALVAFRKPERESEAPRASG